MTAVYESITMYENVVGKQHFLYLYNGRGSLDSYRGDKRKEREERDLNKKLVSLLPNRQLLKVMCLSDHRSSRFHSGAKLVHERECQSLHRGEFFMKFIFHNFISCGSTPELFLFEKVEWQSKHSRENKPVLMLLWTVGRGWPCTKLKKKKPARGRRFLSSKMAKATTLPYA